MNHPFCDRYHIDPAANMPIDYQDELQGETNAQICYADGGTRDAVMPFVSNLGQASYFNSDFKRHAMQSKCMHNKMRRQE